MALQQVAKRLTNRPIAQLLSDATVPMITRPAVHNLREMPGDPKTRPNYVLQYIERAKWP